MISTGETGTFAKLRIKTVNILLIILCVFVGLLQVKQELTESQQSTLGF